ncbi:MAG: hypothetical protein DRJ97_04985 [Thermoprotei archaeon]|nr:MAG: hypothetical protein DRJ97_04985 [Thermoprotei archaeon]
MWHWGPRGRCRGRPMKPRVLGFEPRTIQFMPVPPDPSKPPAPPVYMTPDEFEAYRLVFYEGLTQEEAAKRMGVSRGTLWRCLDSARRKLAIMLAENRPLIVSHEPQRS